MVPGHIYPNRYDICAYFSFWTSWKISDKSIKNRQNVAPQHFVNFRYFLKDISQEVQDEKYT